MSLPVPTPRQSGPEYLECDALKFPGLVAKAESLSVQQFGELEEKLNECGEICGWSLTKTGIEFSGDFYIEANAEIPVLNGVLVEEADSDTAGRSWGVQAVSIGSGLLKGKPVVLTMTARHTTCFQESYEEN